MNELIPVKIELKKQSGVLSLHYTQEEHFELGFEFLRVHSPSAEVRGHGKPILQTGKQAVRLIGVEPAGNYAIKLTFDDGHDSGLYSWAYLRELCINQDRLWQTYTEQLEQAGAQR
jgi:DUF971 family protein